MYDVLCKSSRNCTTLELSLHGPLLILRRGEVQSKFPIMIIIAGLEEAFLGIHTR
jgi:hypothetical protein